MKARLVLPIVLFICAAVSRGLASQIVVIDGSVTFNIPDDYTPLTSQEISAKFPSVNAPKEVVGNSRRTTTIAYQLHGQPMQGSDLGDAQKAFTQIFDRAIPGIEWKQNALVDLIGQKWIQLEFTSRAIDQDIHNVVLITSHKGRMLMFNFNSTRKEFQVVEKTLRDSIQSISFGR